jgi:hypothetical protein
VRLKVNAKRLNQIGARGHQNSDDCMDVKTATIAVDVKNGCDCVDVKTVMIEWMTWILA